jgi:hypothetical protein
MFNSSLMAASTMHRFFTHLNQHCKGEKGEEYIKLFIILDVSLGFARIVDQILKTLTIFSTPSTETTMERRWSLTIALTRKLWQNLMNLTSKLVQGLTEVGRQKFDDTSDQRTTPYYFLVSNFIRSLSIYKESYFMLSSWTSTFKSRRKL